ncbi:MAG TPA: SDR family oxidoreductase [Anaerolineales bacterium]|nr:SDR family oxidoreductase [Anaerolineales bacterium]
MKLKNKVALVTGSGRNIGRAIALAFAAEGADVVVNSRSNPTEAELVAEEARVSGVRAIATLADVSDKSQVDAMFKQVIDTFGHIDILVSNAAIRPQKSFVDLSVEEWRQAIGVILDGAFFCTQAALSVMLANRFGRMIYITGDGAYSGVAQRAHVSAAKMGLTGLARGLATEFAEKNITFNIISPGRMDTSRDTSFYADPASMQRVDDIPMKRLGSPDEIANACVFLSSEEAAYITGQTLHVNGGRGYY